MAFKLPCWIDVGTSVQQAMATVDLIMTGDVTSDGSGPHVRQSTLRSGLRFRGRGAFAPDQ